MATIFVSYRREETMGHAGHLIDDLNRHFGRECVFFDIQTLKPGVDWVEALETALGDCRVLLAVIGRNWLDAVDRAGKRRLDNVDDRLRREVATALQRKVTVVPVLVQGATMPESSQLPDALKALTRRQAIELTDSRWDYDVGELIKALEQTVGPAAEESPASPETAKPPRKRKSSLERVLDGDKSEAPELGKLISEGFRRMTGGAPAPGGANAVAPPTTLAEILPGAWQIQIAHPLIGVSAVSMEFSRGGAFRGQKMVPGIGYSTVQGQWQVLPGNQLGLQGQETNGFQVGAYAAVVQVLEIQPARLSGFSLAGEQVVFLRTSSAS